MNYVDYTYYKETFMGDLLKNEDFPKYEVKARAYIDYITLQRARLGCTNPYIKDAIQMCTCALAEQYQIFDIQSKHKKDFEARLDANEVIASETVGKQSVSYQKSNVDTRTDLDLKKENDKLLIGIAQQYLSLTGLLYRGL